MALKLSKSRKETSCPRFVLLVNSLLNKYGTEQLFLLNRRTKKFWTFTKRWVFSIAEGKKRSNKKHIRNKFWPVNLNIPCPLRASSWICMRAMWGFEHSTSTSSRVFGEHLGPALRWQEQHARMMQDWICKSKKDNLMIMMMMIINYYYYYYYYYYYGAREREGEGGMLIMIVVVIVKMITMLRILEWWNGDPQHDIVFFLGTGRWFSVRTIWRTLV